MERNGFGRRLKMFSFSPWIWKAIYFLAVKIIFWLINRSDEKVKTHGVETYTRK
jgi:hypothetical protein